MSPASVSEPWLAMKLAKRGRGNTEISYVHAGAECLNVRVGRPRLHSLHRSSLVARRDT